MRLLLHDYIQALISWRLWAILAVTELKRRYKRTLFGPFWTTLALGIFIFTMGLLYSRLFNQDPKNYLAYLCTGMIVWNLISSFFTEGATVFSNNASLLNSIKINHSIFIFSLITKNIFIFFHNIIIFVLINIFIDQTINIYTLLIIPSMVIIFLNGLWISTICGILCSRFRDFTQILISLMNISLFVTPIFWNTNQINQTKLYDYNPLYQLIIMIRNPLLGLQISLFTYIYVLILSIFGFIITAFLYKKYKNQIVFWVQ